MPMPTEDVREIALTSTEKPTLGELMVRIEQLEKDVEALKAWKEKGRLMAGQIQRELSKKP